MGTNLSQRLKAPSRCDMALNYGLIRKELNMEAKPQLEQSTQEKQIRAALDQHWAASDANDFETEHRIYLDDAVLEYPQSGERTRGRRTYRTNALINRATSGFPSVESSAAASCGSPNSSSRMTPSRPTPSA